MRGGEVVVADRWFASRKTRSDCGHALDVLPLSIRDGMGPDCAVHHDRDVDVNDSQGHGRKFHGRGLWIRHVAGNGGRLRPSSQHEDKTRLSEEESQLCSCLGRNEQVSQNGCRTALAAIDEGMPL